MGKVDQEREEGGILGTRLKMVDESYGEAGAFGYCVEGMQGNWLGLCCPRWEGPAQRHRTLAVLERAPGIPWAPSRQPLGECVPNSGSLEILGVPKSSLGIKAGLTGGLWSQINGCELKKHAVGALAGRQTWHPAVHTERGTGRSCPHQPLSPAFHPFGLGSSFCWGGLGQFAGKKAPWEDQPLL